MNSPYVVAVLFLVTVFNFVDRQILPVLLEAIKRELRATDSEMGLLTGFAFVTFFALAGLPIARAADARSRRTIIAVSLAFWSGMTMVSGYATSVLQLAAARAGLGIGEAATAPAAQSMLSDLYSGNRRTGVLSLFAIAGPIGVMLAFVIGGRLQEAVGWRTTLIAVGAPGFLLSLLVLVTVREPERGGAETMWIDAGRLDLRETLSYLWRLRSLRYLTAGASFNLFCAWGMTVWSVPFLIRVHGVEASRASALIGLGSGAGGLAGTLAGGLIAEALSRRDPVWQLRLPALTSALAAVFVALFLVLPSPVWLAYLAASFFGSSMMGPVLSVTQSLARVRMRALAAALVGMTFNVAGTGFGPLTVGILSDVFVPRFGPTSLRYALMLPVTAAMLTAAWCFRRGERHVAAELEGAAERV